MTKIAIIGAGISGLTCANKLIAKLPDLDITLFEKSRGVSGRTSTRRAEPYNFDHGAPFFAAKSEKFKEFLQPLINANVVSDWQANVVSVVDGEKQASQWQANERFVGVPKMNAIAKHLAQTLNVKLGTRVEGVQKTSHQPTNQPTHQWQLTSDKGEDLGVFDWVICTAPAQQAAELVPTDLAFHQAIADNKMHGCYTLMLGFTEPLTVDFDVAMFKSASANNNVLSCISVNSQKPQRPDTNTAYGLTILSSNRWAEAHIEADQDWVKSELLTVASDFVGHDLSKAEHIGMHRWRYANSNDNVDIALLPETGYFLDNDNQFAVAGDWLTKGSVENAFLSGDGLADALFEELDA